MTSPHYGNRLGHFLPCCKSFPGRKCSNGVDQVRSYVLIHSNRTFVRRRNSVAGQDISGKLLLVANRKDWNVPRLIALPEAVAHFGSGFAGMCSTTPASWMGSPIELKQTAYFARQISNAARSSANSAGRSLLCSSVWPISWQRISPKRRLSR